MHNSNSSVFIFAEVHLIIHLYKVRWDENKFLVTSDAFREWTIMWPLAHNIAIVSDKSKAYEIVKVKRT